MIRLFPLFLLSVALQAAITVTNLGVSSQQGVLSIASPVGPCTIEVSLSNTYSPVIRDVDPVFYPGANVDTSRPDTLVWADGTHIVTIGHLVADRSLLAATKYYYRISGCGTATGDFTLDNIAPGFTQSYPFPFNGSNWGGRGNVLSVSDILNKVSFADPQTGAKLTPMISYDDSNFRIYGNWGGAGTGNFAYFDGCSGWSGAASLVNGSSSSASTSNANVCDVYVSWYQDNHDLGNPYYFNTFTDMGIKLFGSGTHVDIGLFTNPTDGPPGFMTVDMTGSSNWANVPSGGSDPDHPWPASFPQAFFDSWPAGTGVLVQNRHSHGTMTTVSGLLTVASPWRDSNIPPLAKAGQKIYVDPLGITSGACTNNLCTIQTVVNASQVQLVESINATAGTGFEYLGWGIRLRNSNPGTTMKVGVEWRGAGSNTPQNESTFNTTCPPGTSFSSGHVPAKLLRVCQVPTAVYPDWYLIGEDGFTKRLESGSTATPPGAFFTGTLGWDPNDVPLCVVCGYAPKDSRTWYVFGTNVGGTQSLWLRTYIGDGTEARNWNYSQLAGGDSFPIYTTDAPTMSYDKFQWTIVFGYTTGLLSKVLAYDPSYNYTFYGSSFSLIGVTSSAVYFENAYGGGQNLAKYYVIVDADTSNVTRLINSASGSDLDVAGVFQGNGYTGGHNAGGFPSLDTPALQLTQWSLNSQYWRTISAATSANPVVITDVGHGYTIGSHPKITFRNGNGNWPDSRKIIYYYTTVIDANTISVQWDGHLNDTYVANSMDYSNSGYEQNSATITNKHGGPWLITPNATLRCDDMGYTTGICVSSSWNSGTYTDWPIGTGVSGSGGGVCIDTVEPYDQCRFPGDYFNKTLPGGVKNAVTTCPAGNPFASFGAVGDYCMTISVPSGGFCNTQPTTLEKSTFAACPWDSNLTQPWVARAGQFFAAQSTQGFFGEMFRIVQITPGAGSDGSHDKWVVQRNASADKCVPPGPPYPGGSSSLCSQSGFQNQMMTGWTAQAVGGGPGSGGGSWTGELLIHGKTNPTMQSISGTSHGSLAAASTPGTYIYGAAAGFTNAVPFDNLFPVPPSTFNSSTSPTFHGVSLQIGNGVQSYFSLVPHAKYAVDHNLNGDNFGGGAQDSGTGIPGLRDLVHLTGNIYRMEVYGTVSKYFFPSAQAGGNILGDVSSTTTSGSGPVSALTSPWTWCKALHNDECYHGSTVNAVGTNGLQVIYVNVPNAYDPTGTGWVSQYWANIPWAFSGEPGNSAVRQQDMSSSDITGSRTRQISYLDGIPGSARTYGFAVAVTEGVAVGPVATVRGDIPLMWVINTPPYPAGSTSVAQDVILKPVTVPSGPMYAELQFGYSRFGLPGDGFCSTRQELCNTSGTPYAYESETKVLTTCTSGCTINVPFMAPNTGYYRIRRSTDGSSWTNTTNGSTPSEWTPMVDSGLRIGACADLAYSPTSDSVVAGGGTGSFDVTVTDMSCVSVHTSNAGWLTLTSASGGCSISMGVADCTGDGTIDWTAAANTGVTRSGFVTSDSGTAIFTLSQAGVTCVYSISPTTFNFPSAGGTQPIVITTTDPGCSWTANNIGSTWLSFSSTSGTGDATINAVAIANNTGMRNVNASVATQTFAATQDSGTVSCTFTISPTAKNYVAAGGTQSVSITASDSSCAWTASNGGATWISFSAASGTGSGSVDVIAANNSSFGRNATALIATQSFSVSQDGPVVSSIGVITTPGVKIGSKIVIR